MCEDDGFYELAGLVSWGFGMFIVESLGKNQILFFTNVAHKSLAFYSHKFFFLKNIIVIVCWYLAGCGKADVPGVYVKVSSFIGWINQIISVNNL